MKWMVMDDIVAEKVYDGEVGQVYGVKIVTSGNIDKDSKTEDLL